jgi:hypothetical protein
MTQALQVFQLEKQFDDAFGIAQQSRDLDVALKRATTREARFDVHCKAYDALDMAPSKSVIVTAFESVKRALTAKPTAQERAALIGKMLDVMMINSDISSDYAQALAWKLSDCPKQKESLFHRRKPWLPIPVIAGAIDQMWLTYRPVYGKPPPIPDVLEECGHQSDRLIRLYDAIRNFGVTHETLVKIRTATEDSYPDDDDW